MAIITPTQTREEHLHKAITAVIRNNHGIVAEQITPYLDDIGSGFGQEDEDYILPVLTRLNGNQQLASNVIWCIT